MVEHGARDRTGTKNLTVGNIYDIIIIFGEASGGASMTFSVQKPGGSYQTSLVNPVNNGLEFRDYDNFYCAEA